MNNFDNELEEAIRFLTEFMPRAEDLEKPTLFHSIRVGVYLYNHNYNRQICIAGLLHDAIEDTEITFEKIENKYGREIADIVQANTKNEELENKYEDLTMRCIELGESALIVKAADILDNFHYYTRINSSEGLAYVHKVKGILMESKPEAFVDPIFEKLNAIN